MKDIEWLRIKAANYDLTAEYMNDNTLKVYSKKYFFDSWLIVETEEEFELWHQSKNHRVKGMTYHLQKAVPKHKKIWMLQRINSHNRYVAFHHHINLVDRLLGQQQKSATI